MRHRFTRTAARHAVGEPARAAPPPPALADALSDRVSSASPSAIGDHPPWDHWFENRMHPTKDGISIFFHDVWIGSRQARGPWR